MSFLLDKLSKTVDNKIYIQVHVHFTTYFHFITYSEKNAMSDITYLLQSNTHAHIQVMILYRHMHLIKRERETNVEISNV